MRDRPTASTTPHGRLFRDPRAANLVPIILGGKPNDQPTARYFLARASCPRSLVQPIRFNQAGTDRKVVSTCGMLVDVPLVPRVSGGHSSVAVVAAVARISMCHRWLASSKEISNAACDAPGMHLQQVEIAVRNEPIEVVFESHQGPRYCRHYGRGCSGYKCERNLTINAGTPTVARKPVEISFPKATSEESYDEFCKRP